jgi:Domain of unknown function (DUF4397)
MHRSMAARWASLASWAGCAAMVLLAACGDITDPTNAELRLVNATSGYPALDLVIDDDRRFASVVFGATDRYVTVSPDDADSVLTRPGSTTPLLSLTPALVKQKNYTLLAYGSEGALSTVLLDDNAAEENGKVRIRVLNAAPDAGSVDVYVTAPGDPLSTAVPLQAAAAVGTVGGWSTLAAGTWQVRVTAAGDKTDLRLDVAGVVLTRDQVATVVVAPAAGGVLVKGLLLTQQGRIDELTGAQARVRVAVPNRATVSAAVGGVTLLDSVGGPAVGAYQLVPSGAQTVTVTFDGAPVVLASADLAAGTDQTLLVYRAAGVPTVAWLPDDNRLPSASGNAQLRLVHGIDGLGGALSMNATFLPVATNVALGTASPYTLVTPGANVRITVSAAGADDPVADLLDQTLLAGRVYSVFVVEGAPLSTGFLRRDR